MSIFDRWTDLDPALALRRIEAAHGSAIFDNYAYLDPQRAIHQIESALSINLDDVAGVLSFDSIEAAIDAVVSSSTPDWVPTDAKIYIDLVNDRAWTEADGEVAIDTLLGADANTENGWDVSEYDPTKLTADGYVFAFLPIAFVGTALTKLLAGATITEKYVQPTDLDAPVYFALLSADGNDALEFYTQGRGYAFDSYGGSLFVDELPSVINLGTGVLNAVAATITGSRFELAANGSDVVSGVVASDDRPSGNPLVAAIVSGGTLQSITIYDALPSTTGLSALSETGVTNTAPHDIVWVWNDSAGIVDGVVPQSQVTDLGYTGGIDLGVATATDDQGNPLIWSMPTSSTVEFLVFDTADGGATFAMYLKNINVEPLTIPLGSYNFTLRATDPGGLYVEQEFTITVTA